MIKLKKKKADSILLKMTVSLEISEQYSIDTRSAKASGDATSVRKFSDGAGFHPRTEMRHLARVQPSAARAILSPWI